jgi:hypothetical protein
VIEIPLAQFGLETVAEACDRKGWAHRSVQNWINGDLLPCVVIGVGKSAKYLVRKTDVDAFVPPPRGRPPTKPNEQAANPAGRKRAKKTK